MSVARPAARSLFSRSGLAAVAVTAAAPTTTPTTTAAAPLPCRQFHSSSKLEARRRPRFSNVRAVEMGLVNEEKIQNFTEQKFKKYTPEEIKVLKTVYTPQQIEAIEAGEATIDPRDLTIQGRLRIDPYRLPYVDDFSHISPVIDKRPRREPPPDPNARFMNLDEFTEDLINWADSFRTGEVTGNLKKLKDFAPAEWQEKAEGVWPKEVRKKAHEDFMDYVKAEAAKKPAQAEEDGPTDADFLEYILERSSMTDNNRKSNSALAPGLPHKVPGVAGLYKHSVDPDDLGLDDTGVYQDLKRRTGMSVREILRLNTKILVRRFVSNQTRMGKVRSASVLCIAGNRDGWLGLGIAKSTDSETAVIKSRLLAIQNMRPVRRYENRTIYGTVTAKVGASVVELRSRPPGFGLRVSHRIFEMCRACGIQDLSAKFLRSKNPLNTVKATYEALMTQPDPEEIAIGRGKKLVDVRKVYYGGNVL
ncbi:Ribosomal protein S5, C-terminal domain containing protein [Rhypophila sp. PSN 637]